MGELGIFANISSYLSKRKDARERVKRFIAHAQVFLSEELTSIRKNIDYLSDEKNIDSIHLSRLNKLLRKFEQLPLQIPYLLKNNNAYELIRDQVDNLYGIADNIETSFNLRFEPSLRQAQQEIVWAVNEILALNDRINAENKSVGIPIADQQVVREFNDIFMKWRTMKDDSEGHTIEGAPATPFMMNECLINPLEKLYRDHSENLRAAEIMQIVRKYHTAYHHIKTAKKHFINDLNEFVKKIEGIVVAMEGYEGEI
jgi:hypothetical protein